MAVVVGVFEGEGVVAEVGAGRGAGGAVCAHGAAARHSSTNDAESRLAPALALAVVHIVSETAEYTGVHLTGRLKNVKISSRVGANACASGSLVLAHGDDGAAGSISL